MTYAEAKQTRIRIIHADLEMADRDGAAVTVRVSYDSETGAVRVLGVDAERGAIVADATDEKTLRFAAHAVIERQWAERLAEVA